MKDSITSQMTVPAHSRVLHGQRQEGTGCEEVGRKQMTVMNEIDNTQVTTRFIGRKNTHMNEKEERHIRTWHEEGCSTSSNKKGRAMEEVE